VPADPPKRQPTPTVIDQLGPDGLRALADEIEALRQVEATKLGRLAAAFERVGHVAHHAMDGVRHAAGAAGEAVGHAAEAAYGGVASAADAVVEKVKEARDVAVMFRVSQQIRAQLKALAAREHTTVDKLMNEAVTELLIRKGYLLPPPQKDANRNTA
jgi:hypothetical protein